MKKTLLNIIFTFCANILFAQQASVFEQITTANGLPSNFVFCVTEDSNGFMWAGTDKGLCRFNGAVWELWDTDKGMPGNYVSQIISDKHNGLWLGISEKGVYHFDIETKKTNLVKTNIKDASLTLKVNDNGDLLLTTTIEKTLTYKKVLYKQNDYTKEIKIDEGAYFTDNQFYDDSIHKVTHVFNFTGRTIKNYKQTYATIIPHLIDIKMGEEDYNIAHHNGYIINYNWVFSYNDDNKKDSLFLVSSNKITNKTFATLNTRENLYVAKSGIGLYIINKNNNTVKTYFAENGLANENINHIYKDKEGNIYLSTLGGGINILKPNARLHFTPKHLPLKNIQSRNGHYYGMANGYLYKFNNSQIISETFIRKDALTFYITNDSLMVGSFEGFHYYSFKNNTAILKNTFKIGAGISSIFPFKNDWLISTYGVGFIQLKNFVEQKRFSTNLPFGNIEKAIALFKSFAGLSYEDGFFTCDANFENVQHFNVKNGMLSNYTSAVHTYKDTLWAGGKMGLSLIANNKVVKVLDGKNGFKGNVVKKIFTSNKGELWVVSDKYLHIYKNGMLETIGTSSIINNKKENIIDALYDKETDNLVLSTNETISNIQLSKITSAINDRIISLQQIIIDDKKINKLDKFKVNYNANNISFYFKPIDNLFFYPATFYCKLNDAEWVLISDSLVINFNKLRSGKYTLFTKSINADGKESEAKPIASFTVTKPWWQRWWFIALYSLGLVFIIYSIQKYFNKQKQEKLLQKIAVQKELESERQRISKDLHDNMGAYTSALIANVQQLKKKEGNTSDIQKMENNAEEILTILRETIWILNNKEISLQEFNDGFKNYCFKILKNFEDMNFYAAENIMNNKILTAATAIHLNKILQEAVQNIIKHAAATKIDYSVISSEKIQIIIADNGKGFNPNTVKNGNGLENMEWRAKELGIEINIQSEINKGTTIIINTL